MYEPESVGPLLRSAYGLLRVGGELLLANHKHRFDQLEESMDKECGKMEWAKVERLPGLGDDAEICFYRMRR